jgi:hypothetical protein
MYNMEKDKIFQICIAVRPLSNYIYEYESIVRKLKHKTQIEILDKLVKQTNGKPIT